MEKSRIIEMLEQNIIYTYEFDITTGIVDKDIIDCNGNNYTKLLGLTSPCYFDDLTSRSISSNLNCEIISYQFPRMPRVEDLKNLYNEGIRIQELNIYVGLEDKYERLTYFMYEDEETKHIKAYVTCQDTSSIEKKKYDKMREKNRLLKQENKYLKYNILEQENVYKELMNIQDCGLMTYTYPDYQIIHMNKEALRIYGYETIEGVQDNFINIIRGFTYVENDTLPKLMALRTSYDTVAYEFYINEGKEDEKRMLAKTKCIDYIDDKRLFVTTFVDETDMDALKKTLKKLEETNNIIVNQRMETEVLNEKLKDALSQTEKASKAKSAFLFNMSHDLRTPMNAIIGYANLMETHFNEEDKMKDYLHKLQDSSQFLLSLINSVLEMARIESGKETLHETKWDGRRFEEMIDAIISGPLHEKNLTFTRHVDIQHPNILCDEVKLREIYLNLFSNAIKYTPEGGSIHYSFVELPSDDEDYGYFRSTVSDTGIGISKEFLPHLFEEFSREKNTSQSGIRGTGLGMPIVKALVEMMGGTIEVESELGKGTTFTMYYKHKIIKDEQVQMEFDNKDVINSSIFNNKRILVVEDNALNAEIAITILEDNGFIVEHAMDGSSAINMIKKNKVGYYDLVLMDVQMPVMNGYDATKEIRLLEGKGNVPIIAMTANAFEEDKKAAIDAGMNAHIAKPIEVDKLIETLFVYLR